MLPFSVIASQASESLPPATRYALIAKKLSDNMESGEQTMSQYFPPASTLKVITALAAKLELGDNFRFETKLTTSSSKDYSLIFSGDPTLSTENIHELFTQLKSSGVNVISGDLWLDNTQFTGYERGVGWPWDIVGVCYSAPASAMNINGNCIQSSIYTKENGQTRVFVPDQYPVYVMTDAKSVTKSEYENTHCDLELIASQENHYQLSGCLVHRNEPLPLKFAVQNTQLYAQRIVYKMLNQLGIQLKGVIKVGHIPQQGKIVASHYSEPLPVLLDTMLKKSDNLIADTLTKSIGKHFYQQPGSFNNGIEAIKEIILDKAGISLENDQLVDGSGLSRNNRIQVNSMLKVLHYVWKHDSELGLIDLLPVAGESGTLQYRRSMRDKSISGKIKGKSGSLYATHNMVGYGLDSRGQPNTVFIEFVTDYFPPETENDTPVESPLITFEKEFYQQVVELSR